VEVSITAIALLMDHGHTNQESSSKYTGLLFGYLVLSNTLYHVLITTLGSFFKIFDKSQGISTAMYFSIGFGGSIVTIISGACSSTGRSNLWFQGAINFVFGLPAIRRIDTIGRRKSLLVTIPPMALMMLAASLSFLVLNTSLPDDGKMELTCALVALFLYRMYCRRQGYKSARIFNKQF
jgi:hypothetical protein